MALQPQGNQVVPPIFRIPNEMLLHIQSFLENPRDLAYLAATSRHMWSRLGANDGVHVREARFFERRTQQNQKKNDLQMKRVKDTRKKVQRLRDNGEPDEAAKLEAEDAEFQYMQMRLAHWDMLARPPTLLIAIDRGCPVELVGRILDVYRREMPGKGYLSGLWGRGSWAGYGLTHSAVNAGRVDVLQLLATQGLLTDHPEYTGVTEKDNAPDDDLGTQTPIQAAIVGWRDDVARWLVQNGHVPVDDAIMTLAAGKGGSSTMHILVPFYREQHPDEVPQMLDNCMRHALAQYGDRRGVIDALVTHGADMTERGPIMDQLLPYAVQNADVVNTTHLLGRLAHLHMISRPSLMMVVALATLCYRRHQFLPALITYAYLLAPEGTYDRAAAQEAGLRSLMEVEIGQGRPAADAQLRTAGVGLLIDAGLRASPAHLAIGDDPTDGEAVWLINYLVGRGCPLDPPRAARRRSPPDARLHPLRWLAEVVAKPRAVMCLVAHGARFPNPAEHSWVPRSVEQLFHLVFNAAAAPDYQAARDAVIARCLQGQFVMDITVFDHADPDPVTLCQQILTLYLCIFTPPTVTWQPDRVLVRGAFMFRDRHQWPARLFDVDYYPEG